MVSCENPKAQLISGEGGIISTNNKKIAKNIELYRNHGISRNKKKYWKYDILKNGFNYRIVDVIVFRGWREKF